MKYINYTKGDRCPHCGSKDFKVYPYSDCKNFKFMKKCLCNECATMFTLHYNLTFSHISDVYDKSDKKITEVYQ